MIKVFTTNKDGKIELTKDELKALLDEAYWEGYRANRGTYIYTTPYTWSPYKWTNGTSVTNVTLSTNDITTGAVNAESDCGVGVNA